MSVVWGKEEIVRNIWFLSYAALVRFALQKFD